MKAHYGVAVRGKDLPRSKHTGFYLEVESVKSGIETAIRDKGCGIYFIFEADNFKTEQRKTLADGFIGEVKGFSELPLDSPERKLLLSEGWDGPEMTHVIYERGENAPRFTGVQSLPQRPDFVFEIYTPNGKKVWPVDKAAVEREQAIKARAVAASAKQTSAPMLAAS